MIATTDGVACIGPTAAMLSFRGKPSTSNADADHETGEKERAFALGLGNSPQSVRRSSG